MRSKPGRWAVWPEKNRQISIKVTQKWFHWKNDRFWLNCLRMWENWANLLLPKAWKSCPKCKKSPNLVTLSIRPVKVVNVSWRLQSFASIIFFRNCNASYFIQLTKAKGSRLPRAAPVKASTKYLMGIESSTCFQVRKRIYSFMFSWFWEMASPLPDVREQCSKIFQKLPQK